MTRESILDCAKVMHRRYRAAQSKSEKGALLSEFCEVTGYHRKSAIRLLCRAPAEEGKGRPGRPPSYVKTTRPQGYILPSVRGKGIVSRIWCTPQIQVTVRSTPNPKPECGTEP